MAPAHISLVGTSEAQCWGAALWGSCRGVSHVQQLQAARGLLCSQVPTTAQLWTGYQTLLTHYSVVVISIEIDCATIVGGKQNKTKLPLNQLVVFLSGKTKFSIFAFSSCLIEEIWFQIMQGLLASPLKVLVCHQFPSATSS